MLMFNLLGGSVIFLLSFLGTPVKTEDQLKCCIRSNIVIYQSVIISTADSGMEM